MTARVRVETEGGTCCVPPFFAVITGAGAENASICDADEIRNNAMRIHGVEDATNGRVEKHRQAPFELLMLKALVFGKNERLECD